MTGTGLSEEPSGTATLTALRTRDNQGITVLDLDIVAGRLACSDAMPTIAEVTALWGDVPLEDGNA